MRRGELSPGRIPVTEDGERPADEGEIPGRPAELRFWGLNLGEEIGDLNNNLNFDKLLQIKEISQLWPGYNFFLPNLRSDRRRKDKRDIRSMI